MAKSIRSKRKKKMLALKREKCKFKAVKQQLETLQKGGNLELAIQNIDSRYVKDFGSGSNQPDIPSNTENSNTNEDAEMEPIESKEPLKDEAAIKKLLKMKLPKHLLSQRKLRKLNMKEKAKKKRGKKQGSKLSRKCKW